MAEQLKKGYKIVRRDEKNRLVSCFVGSDGDLYHLTPVVYSETGETGQPNEGGPLAVFDSLVCIQMFLSINTAIDGDCEIWMCEYTEIPRPAGFPCLWQMRHHNDKKEVWEVPVGTRLASSVRLIERVR